MIYYLYVKTHNKTGLKYLGQTQNNPFLYPGSGKRWSFHLQKHGNDVSTEIIGAFDTLDDVKFAGLFWSNKWDIVKSELWANLIPESGEGALGPKSEIAKQRMRKPKSTTINMCKPRPSMIGNKNGQGKNIGDDNGARRPEIRKFLSENKKQYWKENPINRERDKNGRFI